MKKTLQLAAGICLCAIIAMASPLGTMANNTANQNDTQATIMNTASGVQSAAQAIQVDQQVQTAFQTDTGGAAVTNNVQTAFQTDTSGAAVTNNVQTAFQTDTGGAAVTNNVQTAFQTDTGGAANNQVKTRVNDTGQVNINNTVSAATQIFASVPNAANSTP